MKKQLVLHFADITTYAANDFIHGSSNYKAYQALCQPAQWPLYGLIIWGPEKTGKTHLAHIFHQQTGAEFISLSALENLKTNDWVKENTYYILDHPSSLYSLYETELFHFLNLLSQKHSKVLLTANQALAHWPVQLLDLKSRLSLMLSIALAKPDDALLESILLKQAADLQIALSPQVIAYLITHTDRSIEKLLLTLKQVNTLALQEGKKITIGLVKQYAQLSN